MTHPSTYYDLLDAFRCEGCPVCRISRDGVDRYMDSLAYECINDPRVRAQFEDSHGFCHEHARQWTEQPRRLPTAIIYKDVLSHLSEELLKLRYHERDAFSEVASWLNIHHRERDSLEPEGPCPACSILETEEEKSVGSLVSSMFKWDFEDAYAASAGLCLAHLRHALRVAPDEVTYQSLIDLAVKRHDSLIAQLEIVIRRHAPQFAYEPPGEERGAPARAMRHSFATGYGRSEPSTSPAEDIWIDVERAGRRIR